MHTPAVGPTTPVVGPTRPRSTAFTAAGLPPIPTNRSVRWLQTPVGLANLSGSCRGSPRGAGGDGRGARGRGCAAHGLRRRPHEERRGTLRDTGRTPVVRARSPAASTEIRDEAIDRARSADPALP